MVIAVPVQITSSFDSSNAETWPASPYVLNRMHGKLDGWFYVTDSFIEQLLTLVLY